MSPDRSTAVRPSSRERLLAAADALFYAEGIASTGVESLVARSETARGSLYSHFGGKDGLVLAYLQAREDRWRAVWDDALDRCDDARERVLAIFDAVATWQESGPSDHGCAHAAAIAQLADGSPGREAARAHKQATRQRQTELVHDLVAGQGLAEGALAVETLTDDLLTIYEGSLVMRSVVPAPDRMAQARRLADQTLTARLRAAATIS